MADWALLPYDILCIIALNMAAVEDFVYFSVVCHSWNHASSMVKRQLVTQVPYLLLAENTNGNPDCLRKALSLSDDKCYQWRLPETFGVRCWGSQYGWLVIYNVDENNLHLFNPLTRVRISLPEPSWGDLFISKGVILTVPGGDRDDFLVLVIYNNDDRLSFTRPGNQTWTHVVIPKNSNVQDVICHGWQVLILYRDGSLGYCDINDMIGKKNPQPVVATECLPRFFDPFNIIINKKRHRCTMYLVVSFGEVFMVVRYKREFRLRKSGEDNGDRSYRTTKVDVYRLNFDTKVRTSVNNIGDVAFFVGGNTSMSVPGSIDGSCSSNAIYFSDDEFDFWSRPMGGQDMLIFDLGDKTMYEVYEGDDIHSEICTPFWFIPQF